MRDLNIDFMDLYKRTDRFIKDAYSSSEGVSEYIRLMEVDFTRGSVNIRGWDSDYDNLKHIRWIRNQLAHEVSYDCDICSESDYEWLEGFYKRLFSSDDPLAALRKMNMRSAAERVGKRQTSNNSDQSPREVSSPPQRPDSDIVAQPFPFLSRCPVSLPVLLNDLRFGDTQKVPVCQPFKTVDYSSILWSPARLSLHHSRIDCGVFLSCLIRISNHTTFLDVNTVKIDA